MKSKPQAELRQQLEQWIKQPIMPEHEDYENGYTFANGAHLPSVGEYREHLIDELLELIHEREKQARREVKEEVLDTVIGIDARFNPSPSDVRNKIIKAIESLEEEEK